MPAYEVVLKASVLQDLDALGREDQGRCIDAMRALTDDPRPRGCEKLSAQERYRIRAGSYRIIYEVRAKQLVVVVVKGGRRRDVYRTG